jgi:hypothetical protein
MKIVAIAGRQSFMAQAWRTHEHLAQLPHFRVHAADVGHLVLLVSQPVVDAGSESPPDRIRTSRRAATDRWGLNK